MQVTIVHSGKCIRKLADGTRLQPGNNLVDEAVLTRALEVPYTRALFDLKILDVKDAPAETGTFSGELPADLSTLKPAEALKAIAACADLSTLKKWLDLDGRVKIKKACAEKGFQIEGKEEAKK